MRGLAWHTDPVQTYWLARKLGAFMIQLERDENVFLLTLDDEENRWKTTFVRAVAEALD